MKELAIVFLLIVCAKLSAMAFLTLRTQAIEFETHRIADEWRERDNAVRAAVERS